MRDIAILDVPNQRNVGDSLIWAGELAYFKRLGYRIRHISDLRTYDAGDVRASLKRGGVVLLHGGGNLGDLWPGHQKLREKVADELRDFKIVQLPQSVYFESRALAIRANETMSSHPDLTILLRDNESISRAQDQLPDLNCVFCPDMALGYEPPRRTGREPQKHILVIARADHESATNLRDLGTSWASPSDVYVTDWWLDSAETVRWRVARGVTRVQAFMMRARHRLRRRLRIRVSGFRLPQSWMKLALIAINEENVKHGLKLYDRASDVLVDRLHGHVFGVLLGKNHVMVDNKYRKLGAIYDDYTGMFSTAHYSTTVPDAQRRILEGMDR
ncbi:polysaccharide pyruvyl transferase family protein [Microbacterium faecale]|nr:polysaccharide pyruvyl transferase family protein [Microbacterium faecale]